MHQISQLGGDSILDFDFKQTKYYVATFRTEITNVTIMQNGNYMLNRPLNTHHTNQLQ